MTSLENEGIAPLIRNLDTVEVNLSLCFPFGLVAGKDSLVSIEQEAVCGLEEVWGSRVVGIRMMILI